VNNQALTSDLVTVALERVEGTPFERFVNAFYPAISGSSYVPLGGVHDGGADGFFDSGLSEVKGKQGAFLQASIQEDHRAKIRGTVKRLIEFGRTPTSVTYVTSRVECLGQFWKAEVGQFSRAPKGPMIEPMVAHCSESGER
jgi:hypothetical protein